MWRTLKQEKDKVRPVKLGGNSRSITYGMFTFFFSLSLVINPWSISYAAAPEEISGLLTQLKNPDVRIRIAAIKTLGQFGPEAKEAIPVLIETARNSKDEVKFYTAQTLGKIGKAAVPALIEGLSDPDSQLLAARVLRQIGPDAKDAVPALIEMLKGSNLNNRSLSAEALGMIGQPALPALTEALQSSDSDIRFKAFYALAKMGRNYIPTLTEALRERDKFIHSFSDQVLEEIGSEGEGAFLTFIESGKKSISNFSPISFQTPEDIESKTEAEVPSLIQALKHPDAKTRVHALKSLGDLGPEAGDAVPAIIDAAKNSELNVNFYAAQTLEKIGESAVPALTDALSEPDSAFLAARVLVKIGSETPEVISPLVVAGSGFGGTSGSAMIENPAIVALNQALKGADSNIEARFRDTLVEFDQVAMAPAAPASIIPKAVESEKEAKAPVSAAIKLSKDSKPEIGAGRKAAPTVVASLPKDKVAPRTINQPVTPQKIEEAKWWELIVKRISDHPWISAMLIVYLLLPLTWKFRHLVRPISKFPG